jgi:probable HAF family extracellular repeat protein
MAPLLGGLVVAGEAFHVELLPVPADCQSYSFWHGLNDKGQALGVVTCDDFETQRAVLWDDAGFMLLETLGGPSSFAYGFTASGEIVGTAETPIVDDDGVHITRPVVWDGYRPRELETLGGENGGATAAQARGVVVGACESEDWDPVLGRNPIRACVWGKQSQVRDLGDLGGPQAWAYDVNGRGWVVGGSDTNEPLPSVPGFVHHAFLYDGRTLRDLGSLGGVASFAWAVNDRGIVVGTSLTGEVSEDGYASQQAFFWSQGALRELETFGGPYSAALDINERNEIVGYAWAPSVSGVYLPRAAFWSRGAVTDLNNLTNGDNWILESAAAINNRGWILANARHQGRSRVVLLRPSNGKEGQDD